MINEFPLQKNPQQNPKQNNYKIIMKEYILKMQIFFPLYHFEVDQMLNMKEWAIFLEVLVSGSNKRQIKNCIKN